MYLTDKSIPTEQLQSAIAQSPYTKSAIESFLQFYKSAKGCLDNRIFSEIRQSIESLIGSPLNLRKSLDRAKLGRFVAIAELTHRRALPTNVKPLYLLGESPEEQYQEPSPQEETLSKSLRQYEQFCRLLLVGKILPAPVETNGLEDAPLLKVFWGARSLQEVHTAYKELRKKWHPDISPFSESETNARFHWLKQAYKLLTENWSRFDPQNPEIPRSRIEKLKAQKLQWKPESFWY